MAAANTQNNVNNGSTDLAASGSYSGGSPTTTSDVAFTSTTYSPTAFTVNSGNITYGTLNDLDATQTLSVANNGTAGNYTVTLSGGSNSVSANASDLIYVAGGNLTLTGNGTGGDTFGVALGAAGNFDVATGAVLNINAVISGAKAINQTGNGTVILSAANGNTFSATSYTLNVGGTLDINTAKALGASNTFIINGGTIDNTTAASIIVGNAIPQTWNGNFTYLGTTALNMSTGAVTMNGNIAITTVANTLTEGGVISGAGDSLTKLGTGNLTLTGNNTFSGGLIIKSGLVSGSLLGSFGVGTITLGDTSGSNNATLQPTSNAGNYTNPITVQSGSSGNTLTIENSTGSSTYLSGNITLNNNLNVTALAYNTYLNGNLAGSGNITIPASNAGIVWITRNNPGYTGNTTLTAGTLNFANGAMGTGGIAFASNSTLQWAAGNTQDVSGQFQPLTGSTVATLDLLTNNVTFGTTNGLAGPSTASFTKTNTTGNLTLNAANSFTGTYNTGTTGNSTIIANTNALQNATVNLGVNYAVQFASGLGNASFGNMIGNYNVALIDTGNNPVNLIVGSNGGNSTYTGTLSGNGSFTKAGAGTFTLNTAPTSTGGINIYSGTLTSTNNNSPFGNMTDPIYLGAFSGNNSAAFSLGNAEGTTDYAKSITVNAGSTGTLTISGSNTCYEYAPITLANNVTLLSANTNNGKYLYLYGGITEIGATPLTVTILNNTSTQSTAGIIESGTVTVSSGGLTLINAGNGSTCNFTNTTTAVTGTGNLTLSDNTTNGMTIGTGAVNNTGSITNNGTGTAAVTISGAIGANISGVVQTSPTSTLALNGANIFTTGLTIDAGTVSTIAATGFGAGAITLGNSSGSSNATLLSTANGLTHANNITVAAGSSGNTLAIEGQSNSQIFSGTITLNNNLMLANLTSGKTTTLSGSISGTGNVTVGSVDVGGITISGLSVTNTGNLTFAGSGTNAVTVSAASINNTGYIINTGTTTGATTISGFVGTNVLGVVQNSTSSTLALNANNAFTGGLTDNAGTVSSGNFTSGFGAGAITLGNSSGSSNATLLTTANGLTLANNITVAAGSSGNTLTIEGQTNSQTFSGSLTLNNNVTLANLTAAKITTFSGNISGGGNITVANGCNTTMLVFSGNNTNYTGNIAVTTGVVQLGNVHALGNTSGVSFNNGTTLDLNGQMLSGTPAITSISGTGVSGYALTNNGNAAAAINGNIALANAITMGGSALGSIQLGGNISGAYTLTKAGNDTLYLKGANNTYAITTINAGTLEAAYPGSLPGYNATGVVTVASNAILGVNIGGTGEWTTAAGGQIATLLGNVTFNAGSSFGVDTTDASGPVTYPVSITGSQGFAKLGSGTLVLATAGSYLGNTTVVGGTLQNGLPNALPQTSLAVGANGTYDLNGFSQTIGNVSMPAGATITNSSATFATLTINTASTSSLITNAVVSGNLNVVVKGGGTVDVSTGGNYSFMGNTTVTGGSTLILDSLTAGGNPLNGYFGNASSTITLDNGTLENYRNSGSAGFYIYSPIVITSNGGNFTVNAPNGPYAYGWYGNISLGGPLSLGGTAAALDTVTLNATGGSNVLTINQSATGVRAITQQPTTNVYYKIEDPIVDGAGSAANPLVLLNNSTAHPLYITGTSTYVDPTHLDGGVINFATLTNGSVKGSLGNATAAAANLVFGGGTLQVTAATLQSTNRLLTIGDTAGETATLDASGNGTSGSISFTGTGAVAFGDTNPHTLTLTGNNTGNNTFTPALGDNTGTTSLVKSGTGIWIIAGTANTYSGSTSVTSGVLQPGAINAFSANSQMNLANTGGVTLNLNNFNQSIGSLTGGGSVVLGNATLTVGNDNTSPAAYAGVISGNGGLTKIGSGTLGVTGANSYAGNTTLRGGTLDVGASTGGGSLNSSSTLALGGGTLSYTVTGSNTQTFNGTTVNVGASSVNTLVSTDTIALAVITRSLGGTVDFGNLGAITTATANTGTTILGGWATVNGTDWAVSAGTGLATGSITALPAGNYTNDTWAAANDTTVTTNDLPASGNVTNSLRFNNAGSYRVTLAGTNVITTGGILVTSNVGGGATAITGGTLQGAIGADLVVIQNNGNATAGALTIASVIADNTSPTGLTKSGAGSLILTAANSYTGTTTINTGILQLGNGLSGNDGAIAGNITNNAVLNYNLYGSQTYAGTISGTGTATLSNNTASVLTLTAANFYTGATTINSGTLQLGNNTSGNDGSITGNIVNNATLAYNLFGNQAYAGMISGSGSVTVAGNTTSILTFLGNNTYSGGTTVTAGTLALANTSGSATGAGTVTINGGVLGGSGAMAPTGTTGTLIAIASGAQLAPSFASGNGTTTLNANVSSSSSAAAFNVAGGAVLNYNLAAPGTSDLLAVTGNVTLAAGNDTLNINQLTGFGLGNYTLITASNLLDNVSHWTLLNLGNYSYAVTGTPTALLLSISPAGPATITWSGNTSASWNTGSGNWQASAVYADSDLVVFDDSASGNFIVDLGGATVNPGNVTVNNSVNAYSIGNGTIGGNATLAKNGNNTLTLTGNNTYSGGTTVNAGTLDVATATNGLLSGSSVTNYAALQFDGSQSLGTITGNGTTTVSGTGSLTVNNISQTSLINNGAVTVNGTGTVATLSDTSGLGSAGNTTIGSAGNLTVTSFAQANLINNGTTNINGNGTIGQLGGTGSLNIGNGSLANTVTLAAAATPGVLGGTKPTQGLVTIASGSTLDITNNALLLNYGNGTSPLAAAANAVAYGAGKAGNASSNGAIISSTVNTGAAGKYAVGYADHTEISSIPTGNVEVAYTLAGDANLDGSVDILDYQQMAPHYDEAGTYDWSQGDFNHDGHVDILDYQAMAPNYDTKLTAGTLIGADRLTVSLTAADLAKPIGGAVVTAELQASEPSITSDTNPTDIPAAIPEPASLSLLLLGGIPLLGRRRRRI